MSRYSCRDNTGREVAYGHDRYCGYFLQVFDNDKDVEDPVIDIDSLFDFLTGPELVEELDKIGTSIPEEHRRLCKENQPF